MTPSKNRGLCVLVTLAALSVGAQAQTYSFTPFETGGISDPNSLTPISLNATLSQSGTSVDVVITNDSIPSNGWVTPWKPTVTKIAFDDEINLLPAPTYSNTPPIVEFHVDNTVNIPGSNNIGFNTTYGFRADPPPTTIGLDPGEQFTVTFGNTSIKELKKAINSGDVRIALHVQQIGENAEDSASYVTMVPEPSSVMLIGLAGFAGLLRRKR